MVFTYVSKSFRFAYKTTAFTTIAKSHARFLAVAAQTPTNEKSVLRNMQTQGDRISLREKIAQNVGLPNPILGQN
jgi:hypothetical protein